MTANKNQKRWVRAVMEATGWKYTTALNDLRRFAGTAEEWAIQRAKEAEAAAPGHSARTEDLDEREELTR